MKRDIKIVREKNGNELLFQNLRFHFILNVAFASLSSLHFLVSVPFDDHEPENGESSLKRKERHSVPCPFGNRSLTSSHSLPLSTSLAFPSGSQKRCEQLRAAEEN